MRTVYADNPHTVIKGESLGCEPCVRYCSAMRLGNEAVPEREWSCDVHDGNKIRFYSPGPLVGDEPQSFFTDPRFQAICDETAEAEAIAEIIERCFSRRDHTPGWQKRISEEATRKIIAFIKSK